MIKAQGWGDNQLGLKYHAERSGYFYKWRGTGSELCFQNLDLAMGRSMENSADDMRPGVGGGAGVQDDRRKQEVAPTRSKQRQDCWLEGAREREKPLLLPFLMRIRLCLENRASQKNRRRRTLGTCPLQRLQYSNHVVTRTACIHAGAPSIGRSGLRPWVTLRCLCLVP